MDELVQNVYILRIPVEVSQKFIIKDFTKNSFLLIQGIPML